MKYATTVGMRRDPQTGIRMIVQEINPGISSRALLVLIG